jgi:hypothetical protein
MNADEAECDWRNGSALNEEERARQHLDRAEHVNRSYGDAAYSSAPVRDNQQGYAGIELYRIRGVSKERVAAILFWDASGQFSVETFNTDIPLEILEELIAEGKDAIKAR